MSITIDLVLLVIGLLMFALSATTKVQQIGFAMFCVGLLALALGADKVVALIR